MSLQIVKQEETVEKVRYLIAAIGCSNKNVEAKSDQKDDTINRLHVKITKPEFAKDDKFFETIDFESEGFINVPNQFDVREAVVTTKEGFVLIEVPVHKERIKDVKVN